MFSVHVAEHLCRAAMSKPNQKSFFLRAAINPFQESQDSLREANNLRQKHEKMLKKTVPVSSVLHSLLQIINSGKQDSCGEKIVSIATILSPQKSQK